MKFINTINKKKKMTTALQNQIQYRIVNDCILIEQEELIEKFESLIDDIKYDYDEEYDNCCGGCGYSFDLDKILDKHNIHFYINKFSISSIPLIPINLIIQLLYKYREDEIYTDGIIEEYFTKDFDKSKSKEFLNLSMNRSALYEFFPKIFRKNKVVFDELKLNFQENFGKILENIYSDPNKRHNELLYILFEHIVKKNITLDYNRVLGNKFVNLLFESGRTKPFINLIPFIKHDSTPFGENYASDELTYVRTKILNLLYREDYDFLMAFKNYVDSNKRYIINLSDWNYDNPYLTFSIDNLNLNSKISQEVLFKKIVPENKIVDYEYLTHFIKNYTSIKGENRKSDIDSQQSFTEQPLEILYFFNRMCFIYKHNLFTFEYLEYLVKNVFISQKDKLFLKNHIVPKVETYNMHKDTRSQTLKLIA